jgi:transposase InsO family protein
MDTADITYVRTTQEGLVYLFSFILDVYSRRVVGSGASPTICVRSSGALNALEMALWRRKPY